MTAEDQRKPGGWRKRLLRAATVTVVPFILGAPASLLWKGCRDAIVEPRVAEDIVLDAPRIRVIQRRPSGAAEVFWQFDRALTGRISHFVVEVWDLEEARELTTARVSREQRSYVDAARREPGSRCTYYVVLVDHAGKRIYSDGVEFTYRDAQDPPPPRPEGLTARSITIQGRRAVEVIWNPQPAGGIVGYNVYADDQWPGVFEHRHEPTVPVQGTRIFAEINNPEDRQVTIALAALDASLTESERATVDVFSRTAVVPAPRDIRVARESGTAGPVVVRWSYPDVARLVGFRVFEHGLEVADERSLNRGARASSDPYLIAGWTYQFEVQAVFEDGILSARGAAAPFTPQLTESDLRPPRPAGFVAEWVAAEDRAAVRLTWNAPLPGVDVAGYALSVGRADREDFRRIGTGLLTGTEFLYTPQESSRELAFRLSAVDRDGRESSAAEAYAPPPASLLAPARLIDYRVVQEREQVRIECLWRYPASPVLEGFRIYQDGKLVADEGTLRPASRAWLSGVLTRAGRYRFEIEAVGLGGVTSLKAPPLYYDHTGGNP